MGQLENAVFWLVDGGAGRIISGLLAAILFAAFAANVATTGLLDELSWIYGFLAVGLVLITFAPSDD